MKSDRIPPSRRRSARGLTITEVLVILALLAVLLAMGVPMFQRVGCNAMRDVSRANLAALGQAHTMYAGDWNGRQYTMVPDTLGYNNGNFPVWEPLNGCVPQVLLGTDAQGVDHFMGTQCAGPDVRLKPKWLKPIDLAGRTAAGSHRLSNARMVNEYVNGRFYDERFYAPDDPLLGEDARAVIDGGGDFEDLRGGIVLSTYSYSPAAMYDPRVFGFGGSGLVYNSPDTSASLQGFGYRSPSVSQCVHPSLKTRLMEMWTIELAPDDCNQFVPEECVPYQWNQVYRSRPLTAFFDGSVRITTPREFRQADSRRPLFEATLWMKTTTFGSSGVGGAQSADFLVHTSAHFLTTFGIAGRDTVAY